MSDPLYTYLAASAVFCGSWITIGLYRRQVREEEEREARVMKRIAIERAKENRERWRFNR